MMITIATDDCYRDRENEAASGDRGGGGATLPLLAPHPLWMATLPLWHPQCCCLSQVFVLPGLHLQLLHVMHPWPGLMPDLLHGDRGYLLLRPRAERHPHLRAG